MATTLREFARCIIGPRLFKIYGIGPIENGFAYEPRFLERWGDVVIKSFWVLINLKYFTMPVLGYMIYRKCYVALTGLGLLLAVSFGMRAVGRSSNEVYTQFLRTLQTAQNDFNKVNKRALMKYDFEFAEWPVEFKWNDISADRSKDRVRLNRTSQYRAETFTERILSIPCKILSYTLANTIGYKMMFPGSIRAMQVFFDPALVMGRTKLMETDNGERFKLVTDDGNYLDSMFVDRRGKGENGDILVVCCEGNAGFYEIGVMSSPLEKGYSVLGWNYPGFGWSSGTATPDFIVNGVDTVMQFALHKLKFKPENIVMFAWSIGGYPVSWVGMNYPDVKGIILDASFDDVLPLSIGRFPESWEPLIRRTVRDYMNLNNAEQMNKYPGPVLLYRRTLDEIIALDPEDISTNRGNDLLIAILKYRYPLIIRDKALHELRQWLAATPSEQAMIFLTFKIDDDFCTTTFVSYVAEHSVSYPMMIGENFTEYQRIQFAIYLCGKYLQDFNSTHCTNLPGALFRLPWDISPESDFVKEKGSIKQSKL